MKAYINMMMHIESCTDDRAMQTMQDGVCDEDFIWIIAKNPPLVFSKIHLCEGDHSVQKEHESGKKQR